MKKGLIAVSLLLTGALLITPLSSALSQKDAEPNKAQAVVEEKHNTEKTEKVTETNDKTTQTETDKVPAKDEQDITKEEANKQPVKEDVKEDIKEDIKEDVKEDANKDQTTDSTDKEEVTTGMSKEQAEAILNKYIKEVEKSDFTYTYQGDENTFSAIQQRGIRGYVFLPNVDTDMAYLVDKDNGSIYYFHPSGYFELLQ